MTPAAAPTPELARALAQYGLQAVRFVLLSPLGIAKGRRLAYLVEGGSQRIKLRQFESEEAAREVYALRQGLEEAFAPPVGRYDSVLIEEWIDGDSLTPMEAEDRAEEAGALLGRLHARRLAPDVPAKLPTDKWRRGAESDVDILARAGTLAAQEAAHLLDLLKALDPVTADPALIHLDFCAENMILDREGKLRVIDNEQLAVEPAGLDVGRTFHRWPMSDPAWRRFTRGYRSAGPPETGGTGFWRLVAALVGARVFLPLSPARLEASLRLLRRLMKGHDLEDRPA